MDKRKVVNLLFDSCYLFFLCINTNYNDNGELLNLFYNQVFYSFLKFFSYFLLINQYNDHRSTCYIHEKPKEVKFLHYTITILTIISMFQNEPIALHNTAIECDPNYPINQYLVSLVRAKSRKHDNTTEKYNQMIKVDTTNFCTDFHPKVYALLIFPKLIKLPVQNLKI